MADTHKERFYDALNAAKTTLPVKFGPIFKSVLRDAEAGEIPWSLACSTIANLTKVERQRQSGRDAGPRKTAKDEYRNILIGEMAAAYRAEKPGASDRQIGRDLPARAQAELDADDGQEKEKDRLTLEKRTAFEAIVKLSGTRIRTILRN